MAEARPRLVTKLTFARLLESDGDEEAGDRVTGSFFISNKQQQQQQKLMLIKQFPIKLEPFKQQDTTTEKEKEEGRVGIQFCPNSLHPLCMDSSIDTVDRNARKFIHFPQLQHFVFHFLLESTDSAGGIRVASLLQP